MLCCTRAEDREKVVTQAVDVRSVFNFESLRLVRIVGRLASVRFRLERVRWVTIVDVGCLVIYALSNFSN